MAEEPHTNDSTPDEAASSDEAPERADDETSAPTSEGAPGAPLKPHGDPLLASAQGANDGGDSSRHGWAATAGIGQKGTADVDPDSEEEDG